MVWYGMVWSGLVWSGMVWYGMVWYGCVRHGMVWYGFVRHGMVWYGMVWYGMYVYCMRIGTASNRFGFLECPELGRAGRKRAKSEKKVAPVAVAPVVQAGYLKPTELLGDV